MMNTKEIKRLVILNIPYVILGLLATNLGEAWRLTVGTDIRKRSLHCSERFRGSIRKSASEYGIRQTCAWEWCAEPYCETAVYLRGKNAKKYRHNVEYGSARWSA